MKYYTIEELYENGGGQYLVAVESEDDVKKIIEDEKIFIMELISLLKLDIWNVQKKIMLGW